MHGRHCWHTVLDAPPHGADANCPAAHAEQLQHCASWYAPHGCDWYCPLGHAAVHGVHRLFCVAEHSSVRYCPGGHVVLHGAHTLSEVPYGPGHGVDAYEPAGHGVQSAQTRSEAPPHAAAWYCRLQSQSEHSWHTVGVVSVHAAVRKWLLQQVPHGMHPRDCVGVHAATS